MHADMSRQEARDVLGRVAWWIVLNNGSHCWEVQPTGSDAQMSLCVVPVQEAQMYIKPMVKTPACLKGLLT
jgi:hypothetical protein